MSITTADLGVANVLEIAISFPSGNFHSLSPTTLESRAIISAEQ